MKKVSFAAILFLGCMNYSYAQNDGVSDAPKGNKEKQVEQFVGVQINSLVKQVFNFNNSAPTGLNNPYLLTYSINSIKTGWGLRAGIGYNYSSTYNNDGVTETTTKINDLSYRLGIEKAFKLSDKWSAGAGLDFTIGNNNDNTSNTVHSFDTVTTDTKNVISNYGGGAMGWIRYHLTDHILLGTEASFYYVSGTQKQTIDVTTRTFDPGGSGSSVISTTETTSKPTISNGNFNVPMVFYLIVRF